jgi:hypothetical protein
MTARRSPGPCAPSITADDAPAPASYGAQNVQFSMTQRLK